MVRVACSGIAIKVKVGMIGQINHGGVVCLGVVANVDGVVICQCECNLAGKMCIRDRFNSPSSTNNSCLYESGKRLPGNFQWESGGKQSIPSRIIRNHIT